MACECDCCKNTVCCPSGGDCCKDGCKNCKCANCNCSKDCGATCGANQQSCCAK
ncbi:unnamed protein product [Meloidogyne enterolobii]|uniref:Uncharacterized protein n=1 Tax=Meloidogyne enterolobii TaxID=390850 RepID=A0ACB0YCN0_MELEN